MSRPSTRAVLSADGLELDPASIFSERSSYSAHQSSSSSRSSSAVSAAAALGIGPGLAHAHTGPAALSGRILLQNMAVPNRRKPAAEEKESHARRPSSRSPKRQRNRASATGADGGDDAPNKISALRLPVLRQVFGVGATRPTTDAAGSASASTNNASSALQEATEPGEAVTIVGGPDADFEAYEKNLDLHTGEDAIEYFARSGNNGPTKFVYCNRADTGHVYRPYDLIVLTQAQLREGRLTGEYFTISTTGVVHVNAPHPSEVMSLAQWMHESAMFNMLRCIRFFKQYLNAKMFRLWRSNVRYRIYAKQRKALSEKLFLARESFAQPLLEVNKIMYEFDGVPISNVKPGVYQAENFVRDQVDARTVASKKFEEKFERLADQIERVCKSVKDRARQYDHRIANDDLTDQRFAQHLLGGNNRAKSMVAIKKERQDRLAQLEHANLEADMLGDFIRLVDYIEVEHLVQRSVSTTVQFLYLLLNSNKALFQTTVAFAKSSGGVGGTLGGNLHGLTFSPTAREIHSIVSSMNDACMTTVDTVDRILHHPKFKPFVSPGQCQKRARDAATAADDAV